MHEIVVVGADTVLSFDLSTPLEIFRGTRLVDGRAPYRVSVCGVTRTVATRDFEIRMRHGLKTLDGPTRS